MKPAHDIQHDSQQVANPAVHTDAARQSRAAPVTFTLSAMKINKTAPSDLDEAIDRLATAFAHDPITGFLLQTGSCYRERVTQFFSMLMRARIALNMPVLVACDCAGIHGAAMGYTTETPA